MEPFLNETTLISEIPFLGMRKEKKIYYLNTVAPPTLTKNSVHLGAEYPLWHVTGKPHLIWFLQVEFDSLLEDVLGQPGKVVFIILGGESWLLSPLIVYVLASFPSVLLMDSKLFLGGNCGDNSNFSCSCSGDWLGPCLWYCAFLIIIPTFRNMSVSREKARQLRRSLITERMLLRKVLNEGIVQMPKEKKRKKKKRCLRISESFPLSDLN